MIKWNVLRNKISEVIIKEIIIIIKLEIEFHIFYS